MAVELATAYVSLTASAKGIAKSIQSEMSGPLESAGDEAGGKSANKFGGSFSAGMKSAVKVAAAAFSAAAVVQFGKAAIGAASDLSESMSKVDVVFGDSADTVIAWSKDSATAFGQSQQAALEAAGTYGNLFQAFGIGQQPAQEMSQTLVELAADLASFNNTSVDEALQALQSGLSGETEPLKKYGVAINDARLKQEALAMGLISSTKDALTPAAKAQASYALIMKDTILAQGDFDRTSGGLANQQRILSAQWKNAQAQIGQALIPALLGVVSVGMQLIPVFTAVAGVFAKVIGFLASNKPVLIGVAIAIATLMVPAVVAWTTALWAQAAAFVAANAPVIAAGLAIAALVAGVIYAYQNFEWFRTVVDSVASFITDTLVPAFQSIYNWVATYVFPAVKVLAEFFVAYWKVAFEIAKVAVEAVITVVTTLWGWLQTLWDRSEGFRAFLADAFRAGVDVAKGAFDFLAGAANGVKDAVQLLWDKSEPFRAFLADAFTAGVNAAKDAFNTLKDAVNAVKDAVQFLWDKAEPFRSFLATSFTVAISAIELGVGYLADAFGAVRDAIQWVLDKANAVLGPLREIVKLASAIPGVGGGGTMGIDLPNKGTGARAAGGPVIAGRSYVVGEGGWDIFQPKMSGTILSHEDSVAAVSASGQRGVTIQQANFYDAADLDGFARVMNFQMAVG